MLEELYERKRQGEVWKPWTLHTDAMSTHRFDDVARMVRGLHGHALDIGCGAGHLLIALSEQFDTITGFDLSRTAISVAQEAIDHNYPALARRARFFAGDADARMPFRDGEFDIVICCAVIEHVIDPFGLIREASRVCRVGGSLVLTTPNIAYIKHIFELLRGRVPCTGIEGRTIESWARDGWDGGHLHYFTKDQLTKLLRWGGFEPEAWTSDGAYARLRRWSRLLTGSLCVRARRVNTPLPTTSPDTSH